MSDTTDAAQTAPASVSVIIPVRNRARLIGACLDSLVPAAERAASQGIRVEIVAVDDASEDGTPETIRQAAEAARYTIRQITMPSRQGPARARNAGIDAAGGSLIVFVDSDEIVVEDFLVAHVEAHRKAGPKAFTVGTIISVPSLEAAQERPAPTAWDYSGATLDTANASVPRDLLIAVGAFDAGFRGMGWQDIDLGRRLRQHGLLRVQVPEAVTYHIQPPIQTRDQLLARLDKERERGQSAVHFVAKHPGLNARLANQDTKLHQALNWIFRFGGLVREENVLGWVEWARGHRLTALEKIWLAGVINKAYLESLAEARIGGEQDAAG